jgi:hypothetical protein
VAMFGELRKRPLRRPGRRGNDNCKMDLQKVIQGGVNLNGS